MINKLGNFRIALLRRILIYISHMFSFIISYSSSFIFYVVVAIISNVFVIREHLIARSRWQTHASDEDVRALTLSLEKREAVRTCLRENCQVRRLTLQFIASSRTSFLSNSHDRPLIVLYIWCWVSLALRLLGKWCSGSTERARGLPAPALLWSSSLMTR